MLKLATKFAAQPRELENAYRAGFRYAEIYLDATILANWRVTLEQALYYPNGYVLHFPNRVDLRADALEQTVDLYRQLGCRCLVIHQPMYDKYHESLLRLDPQLRLAVENHRLSVDRFEEWAERNPGLTLDIEHLWKFTLDDASLPALLEQMRTFLIRFRDKLLHIHLPGYWPGFPEHRPMYCSREMILPILSLLAEARYEGFVVSEIDIEYQNFHDLRMDALFFESWREKYERGLQPPTDLR